MRSASCKTCKAAGLRDFAKSEQGNVSLFAMTLMVAMMGIGGLALDTMRFEQKRAEIQSTLDACTLMAASLSQKKNPENVVEDCMEKAGLASALTEVDVPEDSKTRRIVKATAKTTIDSFFPSLIGIQSFDANAYSQAEQGLNKIEISLVLDISSSMNANKRIENLKKAAKDYVETVLKNDPEHLISINLIPYSGSVNLGATLRGQYNATYDHGLANVNCLDMPASVYSGLDLSTDLAMPMTSYADLFATTSTSSGWVDPTSTANANGATALPINMACNNEPKNIVAVGQTRTDDLKDAINDLSPIGATAIEAGMRWGVALLDPGSQDVFSAMIAAGKTPSDAEQRPYDYTGASTMKVVVLMTDGANVTEQRVNDDYRTGLSPIYLASNGIHSIYHEGQPGTKKYYVPKTNSWRTTPYVGLGGTVKQLSWVDVWKDMRMSYVIKQFYTRAFPTNAAYSDAAMRALMSTTITAETKNAQLQSMCDQAKAQGVIIYSIAFEADPDGKTQLSNCASSPAHYFDAEGLEIASAFSMIATNISQLKLTQ